MHQGSAKKVIIGDGGVMRLQGQLFIPNVDHLRELILDRAYISSYSTQPGGHKDVP